MMKLRLLMTALAVVPTACTTFRAQSRVDPIRIASYHSVRDQCVERAFKGDIHGGATNLDCFTFKGDQKTAYELASETKPARNRLAYYLINESNTVCNREMGDLTADQAIVNTTLSILTTVAGTAGSIVTGQLASNILSGSASALNASRDHVNAEVYRNQLAPRVTRAIEDLRKQDFSTIEGKFSREIGDYSVEQMIMDVNHYHQLCSYYVGLNQILQDVDRAQLYRADPRRTAALALTNVRAQIVSIDRQLGRKGITQAEIDELVEQRKALRQQETELVKAWAATPLVAEPPPPAPATPEPEQDPNKK